MNGRYSFAEFNLVMSYGRDFRRFILPEKADLFLRYRVLGNAVATTYHSSFKYQEVEWVEEDNESHKWKSLDLTNYYKLSSDTVPIIRDSTYWNIHRDNPLSPDEAHLYNKAQEQNINKIDTADDLQKYVKLTEQLTNTVKIKNSIELFNGFQLTTGISYHRRIPSKKKVAIDPGDDVEEILSQNYNDFTPTLGFSYTPRQYYRMDGYRKEYVYSYYPTISIEIARGIPGVGKSSGDYGRIEADVHQSLMLGLCRRLNYHISAGLYTQQKSTYFADFRYFTRRNFPDTWDDQIGGVFNLLKGEWFNASDKYIQAHFMYESPFVLFKILRINSTKKFMQTASRYILSERFYLSQLWTPVLPSYTEVGYGIGNHIFNIGIFAGFDRWHYQSMGFKFAFELFQ